MTATASDTSTPTDDRADEIDAIVVGAGFSGLFMLYRLRELGLRALVLEAADEVGGTWYWNRYPGARADSEGYYYSYSFSREMQQEWTWTERFPRQPEMLSYLNSVADRYDLRRDIRFGTAVTSADFDDDSSRWVVTSEQGEVYRARFLITAVGCLSAANVPQMPGLDEFQGTWYHTGSWPHTPVDFSGQRVAVIGTGSTGIQVVPEVAQQCEHLTVFQRTPNYIIPNRNAPMSEDRDQALKLNYDAIRNWQRSTSNGHPFNTSDVSALAVSDAERAAAYEAAWTRGSLRFRGTFSDLLTSKKANDTASDFLRDKIREQVHDQTVAEKLVPAGYPFGTKRPLLDSSGYFEAFNRDNVALVDISEDPIEQITHDSIRTARNKYPVDSIIFATGFDAITGALLRLNVHGRDGVALEDDWSEGPRSYLGLATYGFPNMFTITGPGSPSVLTNMSTAIEQHVAWIGDCIAYMQANGLQSIEALRESETSWSGEVQEAVSQTLLPMGTTSWYLGANIPGKPRVFMPYCGGMADYARICSDVAAKGYEGFRFDG